MEAVEETNLIVAVENEKQILEKVIALLENPGVKLATANNEEIKLPKSLSEPFRQLVYYLSQGKAVRFVALNKELTTQEAASLLNVSRPYLIKLLEKGELPFRKVGSHRRINFEDLIAYKERRDAEQQRLLSELTKFSQEQGFYE